MKVKAATYGKTTSPKKKKEQKPKPKIISRVKTDLGVEHDGAENLSILHGDLEVLQSLLVILMRTMREIESRHIHSCPQQLLQHRHRPRSRPQRTHDLRLRHPTIARQLLQYPFYVDVRHHKKPILRGQNLRNNTQRSENPKRQKKKWVIGKESTKGGIKLGEEKMKEKR